MLAKYKNKFLGIIIILIIFILIKLQLDNQLNNSPITLIAFGDLGTDKQIQEKLNQIINKNCTDSLCKGILILGDVIYDKGVSSLNDKQFSSKFEDIFKDINKPFYIALGNRDHAGCVECYKSYSTISAKWKFTEFYYKKSFSNILDLFILDTVTMDTKQTQWLKKQLSNSKAKWKIVAGHHPIQSDDKFHKVDPKFQNTLKKIICGFTDVYLSGHDHNMEDLGNLCGIRLFISGSGGATLSALLPNQAPFATSQYGLMKIEATKKKLSVSFIDINGNQLYKWEK